MGLFDSFPLSNAYSVNLDWIMKKIQEVEEFVKNYAAVNKVAYAGVWDITKQYPQWSLVTDGETSWLSNKPVPVGIPLDNADYWQKLADLDPRISGIIVQISELQQDISDQSAQISNLSLSVGVPTPNEIFITKYGASKLLTDNTPAFTSAIAALGAEGGTVYVPNGVWMVETPVIIPSNVTICGMGYGSVLKLAPGANCNVVESKDFQGLVDGSVPKSPERFGLRNIKIDGNSANNQNGNCVAFFGAGYNVQNVQIVNACDVGLLMYGSVEKMPSTNKIEATIENVDILFTGKHGLQFNGPTDSYFENITVVNASQRTDNTYDSIFLNNNCRMVHIHPWNFNDSYGFKRPRFAVTVNANGVSIVSSHIEGAKTCCLYIENGIQNFIIADSKIYSTFGLYHVQSGGKYCLFSNVDIGGPGEGNTKYACGIAFLPNAGNTRFTGTYLDEKPLCTGDTAGNIWDMVTYSPKAGEFTKETRYNSYNFVGGYIYHSNATG